MNEQTSGGNMTCAVKTMSEVLSEDLSDLMHNRHITSKRERRTILVGVVVVSVVVALGLNSIKKEVRKQGRAFRTEFNQSVEDLRGDVLSGLGMD